MNDIITLKSVKKPTAPASVRAAQEAGRHVKGAYRRDHQRFRRGRAALRPVAGLDRRQDGQWDLDGGDHSGRNPAAGAQRRGRERQPHPHRRRTHHQRRRRDRSRDRLQRAGVAGPRARPRVQTRVHHIAREHVAREQRPENQRRLRGDLRQAGRGRLQGARSADGARVPDGGQGRAARQEHVRARHAVQHLQPGTRTRARADRAHFRQEGQECRRSQRQVARRRPPVGRGQSRLQVPHPRHPFHRAADRGQRQYRAGPRRAGLGHGNLRDVSDHAGHLRIALPLRSVRKSRRSRAPGGRRNRRLRLCDRFVVRGQVRADDHLRTGIFAQAGRSRDLP